MTTIKEVSRRAKVSMATVSRVLNNTVPVAEETRLRVLEAVEALNYKPNAFARGLVTNRSGGIGVVINEISSPFYSGIVRGIEEVAEAKGLHLLVSSGHAQASLERRAVESLKQRRADALILQLEALPDDDLVRWAQGDTPVIVVAALFPNLLGAASTSITSRGATWRQSTLSSTATARSRTSPGGWRSKTRVTA